MAALGRLFGESATDPAAWADATYGTCDLCREPVSDRHVGKRLRNKTFKKIARAGFNPAATGRLGPAGRLKLAKLNGDTARWYEDWKRTVVEPDKTDWVLCGGCVDAVVDPAAAEARMKGRSQAFTTQDAIALVRGARNAVEMRVLSETEVLGQIRQLEARGFMRTPSAEDRQEYVGYLSWLIAKLLAAVSGLPEGPQLDAATNAAQAAAGRRFAERHAEKAASDFVFYVQTHLFAIVEQLTDAASEAFVLSLSR